MGIGPVGKIYHCPGTRTRGGILFRLNNVQSVDVEEERVVAEQFVQFRNHWMVIGNHLRFELAQSLFDLRGIQFHGALPFLRAKRGKKPYIIEALRAPYASASAAAAVSATPHILR